MVRPHKEDIKVDPLTMNHQNQISCDRDEEIFTIIWILISETTKSALLPTATVTRKTATVMVWRRLDSKRIRLSFARLFVEGLDIARTPE